jgi:hypothetical protein
MLWESVMTRSVCGMTPLKVALVTVLWLTGHMIILMENRSPTATLVLAFTARFISRGLLRICGT